MTIIRFALRSCAVLAGLAAALLVAVPAAAHVHIDSPDATPGEFGKLVVQVPTESETASTTKVTVKLPQETPFASVSTKPKPGWKISMKTVKHDEPVSATGGARLTETVSQVTWTAEKGHGIAPGQFDEFELSVGPFPDKPGAELAFPTTQTYSDGSTVAWDEPTTDSGEEPEHPAPVFTLTASDPATTTPTAADETDSGTSTLTIVALVVAVVGLAIAGAALGLTTRSQRRV